MTMGPAEVERKLRQHDNEIVEIYSMLGSIQGTLELHTIRFDEHDRRFDQHDRRFDQHDRRFDQLDAQVDTILELLRGPGDAST